MTIRNSRLRKAWKKKSAFKPRRRRLLVEQLEDRRMLTLTLGLEKTALPTTYSAVGQEISYRYEVTNTGDESTLGFVTVDDDKADVTCPAPYLAPGESMICTATYVITLADMAAGSVTNTAVASSLSQQEAPVDSNEDTATVTLVELSGVGFSKGFFPDTIGPGSTTQLRFDIDNVESSTPVTDIAFTDVLPAGITIADPASASTDCSDGILSAPDAGATISLSGARLGGGEACSVTVNVVGTSTATNASGDLTSSDGNSGAAVATLTVDTSLPGFSKSFAPSSVALGGRSTLTFTIDNTANDSGVPSLGFTDNLPIGMDIADPANASTTCGTAVFPPTLTAVAGTNVIILDATNGTSASPAVAAGASCTVTVDVTATGSGMLDNVSGDLLADFVSTGKASATLESTVARIALDKDFVNDPVPPGGTVTTEFTITNFSRSDSAANISFTDDLDAALSGLEAVDLPASNICGAGSQLTGTDQLTLTGGNLGPGESCTFEVALQVPSTAPGVYTNTTSSITGDVGGESVTGSPASDDLFVEAAPLLTKSFTDDPVGGGGSVTLNFQVQNTSPTSSATGIAFADLFPMILPTASSIPADGFCGAGSHAEFLPATTPEPPSSSTPATLAISGGTLGPGASCSFDITLDVIAGAPGGAYLNTTSDITAMVDDAVVVGGPASDTLVVVAAPELTKEFTDDPVPPGGTATLEFTLVHGGESTVGDATAIAFTDDLSAALAGLEAVGLPINDVCGPGSQISGTSSLSFTGGTLEPQTSCTFSVPVQVPETALPGNHTNTTSAVTASVLDVETTGTAAEDILQVAGLTVTKEFTDDPVIAGDTVTLEFTLDNTEGWSDATGISFTDNLNSILPGTGASDVSIVAPTIPAAFCGGTLTEDSTNFLIFNGGSVAAGTSCSFSLTLNVPSGTEDGTYINTTSDVGASVGGSSVVLPAATDPLLVNSTLLAIAKEFTDDPVAPGDSVTLDFTLTNLDPGKAASDIDFTDDLDAALSGLTFDSVLANDCGATVSGTGTTMITVDGASLAPDGTCTISTSLSVPSAAAAGVYTNTTSDVTGMIGDFAVNGPAASDDLEVADVLQFIKFFEGPTTATGTSTLTFTITNPGENAVNGLAFSDDLDAVIPGLVATSLPAVPCGEGSSIIGTSFLTFTGGSLPPTGGTCSFDVDVLVPVTATAGTFTNTTSVLTDSGLFVADPAAADLMIEPPPTFAKVFVPDNIEAGEISTLTFTIDNSASALAADSLDFTDNLPAAIVVADPNAASTTCTGGTLTADAGTSVVSYTGGSVGAGSNCTVQVDVTGVTPGEHVNTTGDLTSSSGNSGTASDTLTIIVSPPPGFGKTFDPAVVGVGAASTLTFTIDNGESSVAASSLDFTDNLPTNVEVAVPSNASTTCTGGTLIAVAGSSVIAYSGGEVAAGTSCDVTVDVASSVPGSYVNTSGDLTSSLGNSGPASDTLTVEALTFAKSFLPDVIGVGSTSTLTFEIGNLSDDPVSDLAFTDNLPAGVTIAAPANAISSCGGTVDAPNGGTTIELSAGNVAAAGSCTVMVDVTSSIPDTHTNVTSPLQSAAGNAQPAMADLIVLTDRPGFTKSFSPDSVDLGARSTLTFTIDNSANEGSAATDLDFTDNLPAGIVIAAPSNASTTCTGGVLTTAPGTDVISYTLGSVGALTSCTVSVDVIGGALGLLGNTSGELTSLINLGQENPVMISSGKASAVLEVTGSPISLIKSFIDDPVLPGGTVTTQFVITNFNRDESATNITFTDDLDATLAGLVATGLPINDVCGVGSQLAGTSLLTLSGGNLPPEGSCTFNATLQVPAAAATGVYTNTTSSITADVGGESVTGGPGTDDLFVETAPALTKSFLDYAVGAGDTTTVEFTITNTSTASDATDIAFVDNLDAFIPGLVAILPDDGFCGVGSSIIATPVPTSTGPLHLVMTGGNLAPEESCLFEVGLQLPDGAADGEFINTTSEIIATVDAQTLVGDPASDSLVVVAAPSLTKSFTDDPVLPGETATLEFTLAYGEEAAVDATDIAFTDDLDAALSGLVAIGLPAGDVCGVGSQLTGTTNLSLTGGSLASGDSCTFSVQVQVPETALPGYYTNTTSNVTATIGELMATGLPAEDDLLVSPLTFVKSFTDDPALPGGTVTLQFSLDNASPTSEVWDIEFDDDLDATLSGLVATGLPLNDICGTGSTITGTDLLEFTGGNLGPNDSCTFDVTLAVPPGALSDRYNNTTLNGIATVDDTTIDLEPATDALTVIADPFLLTKSFTDDPVAPGGTVTLEFNLTNLSGSLDATGISFTDDLNAALSGLVAVGLPASDVCGAGSQISGTDVLTFTDGNLAPGASCTFSTTLQVPTDVEVATAINMTSQVTGTLDDLEFTGDPATDDLQIVFLEFNKAFDDETVPGGTPTLTFTIENLDTTAGVSGISFSDDLDSVLSGLVATGLPVSDVCGAGSVLSGTSFLTMTGGDLGPEASCTFDVPLRVPGTASPGSYINTTSDLFVGESPVGSPASDTLVVNRLGPELTGGPLTPGVNLFTVNGATSDGIVVLVQGTRPGNARLTVQGVQITTAFADPVAVAFAEVDKNGVAHPLVYISPSQIGDRLRFQAFQILPTVLETNVLSLIVRAGPMLAEDGEGPGAASMTPDVLPALVDEAIERWESTGLTADQSDLLRATTFQVVDLPDGMLGDTFEDTVSIDVTAAGYGWFVDPTPSDDSEYHYFVGGDEIRAIGGIAAAQMDLLTVVMHELGHVLGLADLSNSTAPYELMTRTLATSSRRMPDGSNPSWHNPVLPENVNNDQGVTTLDALILIEDINKQGVRKLPQMPEGTRLSPPYLDVSGDNLISAYDVLEIITYLKRQEAASEGEITPRSAAPPAFGLESAPGLAFVPLQDSLAGAVEQQFETNASTQDATPQWNTTDGAESESNYSASERQPLSDTSDGNAEPEDWLDGDSGLTEAITDIAEDVLSVWQSS